PRVTVNNANIMTPSSNKLKVLGKVRDGSTGKIEKGYWTTNMSGVTEYTKHPIPMYAHLYSSEEDGFSSENEETYKGLRHVRNILDKKQATFVMARDYDNIKMMKQILEQEAN